MSTALAMTHKDIGAALAALELTAEGLAGKLTGAGFPVTGVTINSWRRGDHVPHPARWSRAVKALAKLGLTPERLAAAQ